MYQFLDIYWKKIENDKKRQDLDDLGGLLGSMNPNLWNNGIPIDKGLVSDWELITQKREIITESEGFSYMVQFLEKQLSWLNLKELVAEFSNSLKLKDNNWHLWLDVVKHNSD